MRLDERSSSHSAKSKMYPSETAFQAYKPQHPVLKYWGLNLKFSALNEVKESTKIRQVMDIGMPHCGLAEIHPHDLLTEERHHARNFSEFKNTWFCLSNSLAPSACVSSIQVKTWHSWLFLTNSNPKIWKSVVDTMWQREAYGSAEFEKYKLTILLCAFSSPPSSESKSWIWKTSLKNQK